MTQSETWTIGRLLEWTTGYLKERGADSPRLDAELLLAESLGCPRIQLYAAFGNEPDEAARTRYRELVKRRAAGMPVAYLLGQREFFSMAFRVTPDVLIPRPDTEALVVRALDLAKSPPGGNRASGEPLRIVDVGTGSGCIAIVLAKHLPQAQVTAIDISPAALAVARENAERHGMSERMTFVEGDLLASLPSAARFDLVVSNPPYVRSAEMPELEPEVRDHEPALALDAGPRGTEIIERLVPQAAERLRPGGWLLMEMSPMIDQAVQQILDAEPRLTRGPNLKDLAGRARVAQAQRRT